MGSIIRVWEVGGEVRPKQGQVLSGLQTDPKSPSPGGGSKTRVYRSCTPSPWGWEQPCAPEQGWARGQDSDVARSSGRGLRVREAMQEEFGSGSLQWVALWLFRFQTNHPLELGTGTLKEEAGLCVLFRVYLWARHLLGPEQSGGSRGRRISKKSNLRICPSCLWELLWRQSRGFLEERFGKC